jgi:predicted lysophospholipase L1 biosynthesis ABC-type transport system permease subunit
MISRKAKFLSVVASLAVLIATVAVARNVHTHLAPAGAQVSSGKVTGAAPSQTTTPRQHGIIVCGMALDSDCEKLETLMPM